MPPAVAPLWMSSVSNLRLLPPTDRGFKLTGKRARGGRIDLWLTHRSVSSDIVRQVHVPFEEAEAIMGTIADHGALQHGEASLAWHSRRPPSFRRACLSQPPSTSFHTHAAAGTGPARDERATKLAGQQALGALAFRIGRVSMYARY